MIKMLLLTIVANSSANVDLPLPLAPQIPIKSMVIRSPFSVAKVSGFFLRQGGFGSLPLFIKRLQLLLRLLIGALNIRGFLRVAV